MQLFFIPEEKPNDSERSRRAKKTELVEGSKNYYHTSMISKDQKWYVYIAQARTGRFYVGITPNVKGRIDKHNSGKGSMFAIEQGPFTLAYCSNVYPNKSEARKREIQIKGWTREKKQKLISGEYT